MDITHKHTLQIQQVFSDLFKSDIKLTIAEGKKEFACDYTLILFPIVKALGISPNALGDTLGKRLKDSLLITDFELVKGFLNFNLADAYWNEYFTELLRNPLDDRLHAVGSTEKIVLEYCSPNTNKPLHLGHIRNIVLGWSLKNIFQALGHSVHTTQVINDRGIAICKSMLAWQLYGEQQTPQMTKMKGDHFVGHFYVLFEAKFKEEYKAWQQSEEGKAFALSMTNENETLDEIFAKYKNEYFNTHSALGKQARHLLKRWESSDQEVKNLWSTMNAWVYEGFQKTYSKLHITFDSVYYESNTYLLGNDIIEEGLQKNIFYQLEDGSTWIDLEEEGLDKKIVRRSDGTSVYITQDLGTARQRHIHHQANRYLYVVADEQDYHFKILFATLHKLKEPYSNGFQHVSYGMVDLPSGKMKSREGTVVDADELIDEVINEARKSAEERGEIIILPTDEQEDIFEKIGLSALKYFILKVQAKKRMIFDPKESVDLQGNTGPYIMNAYVRIKSILRKTKANTTEHYYNDSLHIHEKELLRSLGSYPDIIREAADKLDPAPLANYLYSLAKDFHRYYHDVRILNAETEAIKQWRLQLCWMVSEYIKHGMNCLGIELAERM